MSESDKTVTLAQAPKKALVYLRVSSAQQAETDYDVEGFSIPAQREACRRRAAELEAEVEADFVDRGESARSADRPALQRMLARLEAGGIDYVIVHKLDRLARNRADDVEIAMRIKAGGAVLVSVTENIDETPSGMLVHGIMSSIAEFYSRNLASEIVKGSRQKAKNGGTLTRAPIGYLNVREFVDGREIRTIGIDEERAPYVQLAFELYATGNYSLSQLSTLLEHQGLRSRATRRRPSVPVTASKLQAILRNPYYKGIVSYQGESFPGRHQPLVDDDLFERVGQVLSGKKLSGERDRKHRHYLKGSLYCGECGRRLTFSRNTGNGGSYDYFVCSGKQRKTCSQGYLRTDHIEAEVEKLYATVQLTTKQRAEIRRLVETHLDAMRAVTDAEANKATAEITKLLREERKLLELYYADLVSREAYAEETKRIADGKRAAQRRIDEASGTTQELLEALNRALEMTTNAHKTYLMSDFTGRRLMNQMFFKRIEVKADEIDDVKLSDPYAQLLAQDLLAEAEEAAREAAATGVWEAPELQAEPATGPGNQRTLGLSLAEGSISTAVMELWGFEPQARRLSVLC